MTENWMDPYLDLANRMIDVCVNAQVGGLLPSTEQMDKWRVELKSLLTADDDDLLQRILLAEFPEQLIHVAGMIMGRESNRRERKP